MTFVLPKLSYSYDALEPHFDAKTMEIHHTKHHQAYVDKLNKALEGHTSLQEKSVEDLFREAQDLPEEIRQQIINHGGGHFNHSLWWNILGKEGSREPVGEVKSEIEKVWGSFDKFKEEFTNSAISLFGSGWTWLGADEKGTAFHIHNHPNQENPLLHNHIPVLGIDLWEHSYYLKYQNKRPDYITAFWEVLNWEKIEEQFQKSK